MGYLLLAAMAFGVMCALDKGFTTLMRSRQQHRSGTAVRLKKGYGTGSVLLCLLAALSLISYSTQHSALILACGVIIGVAGAALGVYYLRFGIFYDAETFLYATMTQRSVVYRYADITAQKLYVLQGGSHVVELYMADGTTVSVQTSMEGAYDFLDSAAHARFRQLGVTSAACDWFDPASSRWFPPMED